jgi:superfamily II DNA helicase RecQ
MEDMHMETVTDTSVETLIDNVIPHSLQVLGYESVRAHQEVVLKELLSPRPKDCLFIAPTGNGKSLIFEALPFASSYIRKEHDVNDTSHSIILVISPLISLMKLQAKSLRERGICAAYLQVC